MKFIIWGILLFSQAIWSATPERCSKTGKVFCTAYKPAICTSSKACKNKWSTLNIASLPTGNAFTGNPIKDFVVKLIEEEVIDQLEELITECDNVRGLNRCQQRLNSVQAFLSSRIDVLKDIIYK